jgi:ATP-dependent Clp endopeptidase proteolytic subunit ClpP
MNEGHIFITGDIDGDLYEIIKPQIVAAAKKDKIFVHINSRGGSVDVGMDLYHELNSLGKPIDVIIKGKCMSIATLISMVARTTGGKIIAYNPSEYMVHNSWTQIEGNAKELENGASQLKKIDDQMAAIYKSATGLDESVIRAMLDRETFLTPTEAKTYGFIDEVMEPSRIAAYGEKIKPMNKETKDLFKGMREAFERVAKMFGTESAPSAASFETDKGMLTVDGEGPIEGKPATINGQPAPDGDYKLSDGKTITVSGGMITTVNEGTQPPPAPEAPEDKLKKMEAEFAALKAENEQLKSAQAAVQATEQKLVSAEQELVTVKASATQTREAFAQLKTEYESLEKKVVGDVTPPTGAKNSEKTPKEDEDSGMLNTKDFLKEYAPHLVNLKKS